jgi:hypothetical protein
MYSVCFLYHAIFYLSNCIDNADHIIYLTDIYINYVLPARYTQFYLFSTTTGIFFNPRVTDRTDSIIRRSIAIFHRCHQYH